MRKIVKASQRHRAEEGWLKAYRLFSFGDYEDHDNMQFGNLRVFNEDVIDPYSGYPHHSHNNMEIVTLVFSGELTHEDDMGNKRIIGGGECQRMSAGNGVIHSEFNFGSEPVSLYQIWFEPDSETSPEYEQEKFSPENNQYVTLASKEKQKGILCINASAKIDFLLAKKGFEDDYLIGGDKGLLLYIKGGEVDVGGEKLSEGDHIRISSEDSIKIKALSDAELILVVVSF